MMIKLISFLFVFLLSSCTSTKEINQSEIKDEKDIVSSKIEDFKNKVTFDCLGSSETIINDEYFRLSMPCVCEIVDSVKVGSEKHIGYVINWLENVRIKETHTKGNFVCKTKNDRGGTKSYLRGKQIFEALLHRISNTQMGFQCPDDPDATGFYFPVSVLCRHLFKMVASVDGLSIDQYIAKETPDVMQLINSGLDYHCHGNITKPVFEKLKTNYQEGKVILKPFDKKN